jgi:hypothetical protein
MSDIMVEQKEIDKIEQLVKQIRGLENRLDIRMQDLSEDVVTVMLEVGRILNDKELAHADAVKQLTAIKDAMSIAVIKQENALNFYSA